MAATFPNILLVITVTTTALITGLFYAWSCAVNLGLGRLSDAAYLEAMQSINRAILNPVFFLSFLGTVVLLPLSAYLHYGHPVSVRFWYLLAAALVYIIGGFGVTVAGNVPLNEALDAFNLQAATQEAIAVQRAKFEGSWNNLHTVRTIACVLALVLVIIACLSPDQEVVEESLLR
jgi:uncharacterized membrane protein